MPDDHAQGAYRDPLDDRAYRRRVLGYHPASTETAPRHAAVRNAALEFSDRVMPLAPPSPERTLAWRHIQYAMMMLNAAVAVWDGPPVPDDQAAVVTDDDAEAGG